MRRKLTEADLPTIRRMFLAGDNDDAIARVIGCGKGTVQQFRLKHGLRKPRGNPIWLRGNKKPEEPKPVTTYVENGLAITILPPGFADGIEPQPTARARLKKRLPRH